MIDSKNIETYEKIYLAYLRKHPHLSRKVNSLYFKTEEIQFIFKVFQKYYKDYSETPGAKQLWELVNASGVGGQIDKESFKSILKTDLDDYDSDWVEDSFDVWINTRTLDDSVQEMIEYLRDVKINEDNYKDVIQTTRNIINDRNSLNFRFDTGLDFFDPGSHYQDPDETGLTTGYGNLDNVLGGGFPTKTLNVIMGESNIGKSIFLANLATNAVESGYNTVYITAEMADKRVIKRLGSNLLRVPMSKYDEFSRNPQKVKERLNRISGGGVLPRGRLFVKEYPTSEATVADIESYIRELEETEGIKISHVVIDYINLLADQRGADSENTYVKIKNIAEDLRAMMVKGNHLGISVTQVNGSGLQSSDLHQGNISESKALAHTCDSLFGIIQTPDMHAEEKYLLKSIKLRDSGGKFVKVGFDINYDYMRLTENGEVFESNE